MGSCVARPGPAIGAVIELDGISKRYWQIKERSLLRALIPLGGPNRFELWALRDVELRIGKGETVGIIGHNGAGKSTLLRLLAGVSQPTLGTLAIRGRIAPLLSVGAGFHPEMTGRENVFVNGMLLGLTRPEIRSRVDEIVEFTGLSDFIDTPVKFYSSGMFMRLGFSVAAAGPVASRSTLPTSSRRSFPRTSTGPPSTFHPARRGRSGRDGGGHQRRRGAADQLRVGPLRERVHRRGATGEGWRTSLIGGVCPVRTQASRRASRGWPSRGRLLVAAG